MSVSLANLDDCVGGGGGVVLGGGGVVLVQECE